MIFADSSRRFTEQGVPSRRSRVPAGTDTAFFFGPLRFCMLISGGALFAASLAFWWRYQMGSLTVRLTDGLWWIAVVGIALWAAVVRGCNLVQASTIASREKSSSAERIERRMLHFLPTVSLLLMAWVFIAVDRSVPRGLFLVLLWGGEEVGLSLLGKKMQQRGEWLSRILALPTRASLTRKEKAVLATHGYAFPRFVHKDEVRRKKRTAGAPLVKQPEEEGELIQAYRRFSAGVGREWIVMQGCRDLLPGQRTAFMHVSFCPPFEKSPRVECHQQGGPPATIKVAQVFPYGARLEIRLNSESPRVERVDLVMKASIAPDGSGSVL